MKLRDRLRLAAYLYGVAEGLTPDRFNANLPRYAHNAGKAVGEGYLAHLVGDDFPMVSLGDFIDANEPKKKRRARE